MQLYLKETFTSNSSMAQGLNIYGHFSFCIKGTWDGAKVTLYRKNKDDATDIDKLKEYTEGTMLSGAECEQVFSESEDYVYYAIISECGASTSLSVKLSTHNYEAVGEIVTL